MPISTWCYIPTSLPQEQAAKTDMLSVVSIQVLCTVECAANACIWLTQHPWSWKTTTLAEYKGDGIYLRNPLTQSWLQASKYPMPEFNLILKMVLEAVM